MQSSHLKLRKRTAEEARPDKPAQLSEEERRARKAARKAVRAQLNAGQPRPATRQKDPSPAALVEGATAEKAGKLRAKRYNQYTEEKLPELGYSCEGNGWLEQGIMVGRPEASKILVKLDSEKPKKSLTPIFSGALTREAMATIFKTVRAERELSQRAFADELGITHTELGRIERGEATLENSLALLPEIGIKPVFQAFEAD